MEAQGRMRPEQLLDGWPGLLGLAHHSAGASDLATYLGLL